jgi:ribonuclease Z
LQFTVTIYGSSAAIPGWGRNLSAQVVQHDQALMLVDCGEGTQHQLLHHKVRLNKIGQIFISHLHGDHYLGLMGLLSTMQLQGRTEPLQLFAPRGLADILTVQWAASGGFVNYLIDFQGLTPNASGLIYQNELLEVHHLPLDHRLECHGFVFKEKPRLRKIVKELLPPDLPVAQILALKHGQDVEFGGQILTNEAFTRPPRPVRTYAYCSDTRYNEQLARHFTGADLLYHEATFAEDYAHRAAETYHSTAKQAAQMAQLAQVKQLLLGHFSVRYRYPEVLLAEAQTIFPATALAWEGSTFSVGEPW